MRGASRWMPVPIDAWRLPMSGTQPVDSAPGLPRRTAFAVPTSPAFRIVNARVPAVLAPELADHAAADGFADCDIVVDKGRIAGLSLITARPAARELPTIDLRAGIVLPRFVDVHTHIDKGHIWPRRSNPDGTHPRARGAVAAHREAHWSAEDVRARMDFSLRCAFSHGSGALRTHIDSLGKQAAISWPVFAEMREHWKGRIALQGVALFPADLAADDEPQFRAIVETAARHGGLLGGITF